ncbi:hypothetical protein LIP_0131 [Limnochorda pilosa]|uniref:Uncharacterized protein n=1 Tax=Limnochorda pilosa TaxID=1555112 RepID=A0A0K2SFV7_LIMPI|nr:hypothetical protein LIP_0131 [Limnochorda pilosa]
MRAVLVHRERNYVLALWLALMLSALLIAPSALGAFWAAIGVATAGAGPVAAGAVGAVGALHSTIQGAAWGFVYGGPWGALAGLATGL